MACRCSFRPERGRRISDDSHGTPDPTRPRRPPPALRSRRRRRRADRGINAHEHRLHERGPPEREDQPRPRPRRALAQVPARRPGDARAVHRRQAPAGSRFPEYRRATRWLTTPSSPKPASSPVNAASRPIVAARKRGWPSKRSQELRPAMRPHLMAGSARLTAAASSAVEGGRPPNRSVRLNRKTAPSSPGSSGTESEPWGPSS